MGPEWIILLFFIAIPVLCGVATMVIAQGKGWVTGGEKFLWFVLGFFFPLIGIIVAALISPKTPVSSASDDATSPPPPQKPG